jgi:hypothetical protein
MQAITFCAVFCTLFGGPLFLVICILPQAYLTPMSPWADLLLSNGSARTKGVLRKKELVRSVHMGDQHPWRVAFRFRAPAGQEVDAVAFTYDPAFETMQPGDPIAVEYHPARPAWARPVGGYVAAAPPWVGLVLSGTLGVLPLMGVVSGVLVIWRARRERRLLAYGVGVVAEVQRVRRIGYIHFGSKNPYDVTYHFYDHARQPVAGKDRTYGYAWAEALRPGDRVGVIYHPFRPAENVLWLHGRAAAGGADG